MSDMLHKIAHKFLLPGKFSDSRLLILLEKDRTILYLLQGKSDTGE